MRTLGEEREGGEEDVSSPRFRDINTLRNNSFLASTSTAKNKTAKKFEEDEEEGGGGGGRDLPL